MLDQASKLREMIRDLEDSNKENSTKIYSIVSGADRVGKSQFSINLANEFKKMGKKVILLNQESNYMKDLLRLSQLNELEKEECLKSLLSLRDNELVIIDCKDGISKESLDFTNFAHEVILVTIPETITYAYGFLKFLSQEKIKKEVKVFINYNKGEDKPDTFHKLNETVNKFLDISLEDISNIHRENLVDMLYNSRGANKNELKDKILNIFGG